MSPFMRAHTTSYSPLAGTVRLPCTIFEIKRVYFVKSRILIFPTSRVYGNPVRGELIGISPRSLATKTRVPGLSCSVVYMI